MPYPEYTYVPCPDCATLMPTDPLRWEIYICPECGQVCQIRIKFESTGPQPIDPRHIC